METILKQFICRKIKSGCSHKTLGSDTEGMVRFKEKISKEFKGLIIMFIRNAFNKIFDYGNQHEFDKKHVSLFECAALSLDVYKEEGRPPLPEGWEKYKSIHSFEGYYGAIYIKRTPIPNSPNKFENHIVIAHRGTDNLGDLILKNTGIIVGDIPFRFAAVFKQIKDLLTEIYFKYGSFSTVLNTGHSLGGVYAEMTAAKLDYPDGAISFENPGTEKIIRNAIIHGVLAPTAPHYIGASCCNFVNDVNFINTCNGQLSKNYMMEPHKYDFYYNKSTPIFYVQSHIFKNVYYWKYYSIHQHKMSVMYDKLKDGNTTIVENSSRPSTLQDGYKIYLNYDARKDYWDPYMQIVWDRNVEDVHRKFKNFSSFKDYFSDKLRQMAHQRFLSENTSSFFSKKNNTIQNHSDYNATNENVSGPLPR